mmetsp:Transcript_35/g.62  ORF Transcript_35/g.62 Transcript_35/m.62 type:complete len:365 (+) Transcript_35:47-1141(+)
MIYCGMFFSHRCVHIFLLINILVRGIDHAIFSEDSILEWDPYKINNHCPRFVEAGVGNAGLGDELEHFIYSLNIAKLFEAIILIHGGLISGSKISHIGSAKYSDIAELLGIQALPLSFVVENNYSLHRIDLSFSKALELKGSLLDGTGQLPCNTTIRSDINSCQGQWCPVMLPEFDFIKNVASIIKNNRAKSTCIVFGRGFGPSCKSAAINVVWHIRTGDIDLHKEDSNYFNTLLTNLLFVLSANESDIGSRIHLAFETQLSVPFLERLVPAAKFHVGRDILDTVCSFMTSDIFISSGSSFALVLAFSKRNQPIIFEEVRKEALKQRHIFREEHAILLERGQPVMKLDEVKEKVEAALKIAKTC